MIVAALLLMAGCGESQPRDAEVEDFRFFRQGNGTQVVQGVFVNSGQRYIRGARITVLLYEGDHENVADSMSIEVLDIEPGERKTFRHEVDTARLLTGARVERIIPF